MLEFFLLHGGRLVLCAIKFEFVYFRVSGISALFITVLLEVHSSFHLLHYLD